MTLTLLRKMMLGVVFLGAILCLVQCSFMPEGLEAFYALPVPDVSRQVHMAGNTRITYAQTGNIPQLRPAKVVLAIETAADLMAN